jgi:uncharacterized protein with beta-barrel porin domain
MNAMNQCGQCKRRAMYEVQGHLLCLDCFSRLQEANAKMQQANNERVAYLASYQNFLIDSMMFSAGLSSRPPRQQIPQHIRATMHQGHTFNNINISKSVIGMLNTGQIQGVRSISVNVSVLAQSGHKDMAEALKHLTEAVAENQEITDEQRTELLDQLDELSTQAAMPPDKRVKRGVTKAILTAFATGMGAAGGLAEVWSTWGQAIRSFFGF